MKPDIQAVFLDVGNTLRVLVKDPAHMARAREQLAMLARTQESPEAFYTTLDARYKVYRKWAFANTIEASEKELWTRWLLPDFPADQIAAQSGELTFQFRQSMGRREMVRDAKQVVIELHKRGYTLGIISNVITEQEIPDWLDADGLTPYFKSVMLSSVFGKRKPDPAIYWEAARRAGVEPKYCAYVGDNPKRDVVGTYQAGFSMVVILIDPVELEQEPIAAENKPDVVIHEFNKLLGIFPARA
jgi:putative hydrolase of the HAD superfamily